MTEHANIIRYWHERMIELDRQSDALSALTGAAPDSPLMAAIWHMAGHYTELADLAVGGGGRLPWFWLECGLGAHPLQAANADGKFKTIAALEDLIELVEGSE